MLIYKFGFEIRASISIRVWVAQNPDRTDELAKLDQIGWVHECYNLLPIDEQRDKEKSKGPN